MTTIEKDHDRCKADIFSQAHSNYEPNVWVLSLPVSAVHVERDELMYKETGGTQGGHHRPQANILYPTPHIHKNLAIHALHHSTVRAHTHMWLSMHYKMTTCKHKHIQPIKHAHTKQLATHTWSHSHVLVHTHTSGYPCTTRQPRGELALL